MPSSIRNTSIKTSSTTSSTIPSTITSYKSNTKQSRLIPLSTTNTINNAALTNSITSISNATTSSLPTNINKDDKQSLCLSLLQNGNINSFIDFFYLTYKQEAHTQNDPSIHDNNTVNKQEKEQKENGDLADSSRTNTQREQEEEGGTESNTNRSGSTKEEETFSFPDIANDEDILLNDSIQNTERMEADQLFHSLNPFGFDLKQKNNNESDNRNKSASTSKTKPLPLPEKSLPFLSSTLSAAESAHRLGALESLYQHYNTLSRFFSSLYDYTTSIYFQSKNLDLSQQLILSSPQQQNLLRIKSLLRLGILYEKNIQMKNAIEFYEQADQIAKTHALSDSHQSTDDEIVAQFIQLSQKSRRQLIHAYHCHALEFARQKNFQSSIEYFKKAHAIAYELHDLYHQTSSYFCLGLNYFYLKNFPESIQSLQSALTVAKQSREFLQAESLIHFWLAHNYLQTQDYLVSLNYLEKCTQLSRQLEWRELLVESLAKQGEIYSQQNNHLSSMYLFEQCYEVARQDLFPNKSRLEMARINVGIARGNVLMQQYMSIVSQDEKLPELFLWKTKRQGLKIPNK